MGALNVDKSFVQPLMTALDLGTRERIEAQSGQLLLLDDAAGLKSVLERTLQIEIPTVVLTNALKAARAKALALQNNYKRTKAGKRKYNIVVKRLGTVIKRDDLKIGVNAFVVASFNSSIVKVKQVMLDSVFKDLELTGDSRQRNVSEALHRGHGEAGLAVSQVQLSQAFNRATKLSGGKELLIENFNAFLTRADIDVKSRDGYLHQVERLSTEYSNMLTKTGVLRAQYFSIITFQDQEDNAADGILEKKLLTLFRKFVKTEYAEKVLDIRSSPSIRDKVESAIVTNLTEGLIRKNVKVTITGDKPVRLGKVDKAKGVAEIAPTVLSVRRQPKGRVVRGRARQGASSRPLAIMAQINKDLPETVRKNMGVPGLENRTGAFSESVRMVDAQKTAQGFTSFGYTYDRAPYGVFEMGGGAEPWATTDRDPRKVIDVSIRELAARYAIGRFYTRRV